MSIRDQKYSKDWCNGFCGKCGTSCAEYCEQIHKLQASEERCKRLEEAMLTSIALQEKQSRERESCKVLREALRTDESK